MFDFEPEDAYVATDPPRERLANIVVRLRLLVGLRQLADRDRHRLDQAIEDLELLAEQL
jgi:hypothetical protein